MATRKAATPKPAAADGAAARKTGRPSKYKDEFAGQAAKLCKLGATDAQLADFFGVAISTVALWKVEHPAFSDALRVAKRPLTSGSSRPSTGARLATSTTRSTSASSAT